MDLVKLSQEVADNTPVSPRNVRVLIDASGLVPLAKEVKPLYESLLRYLLEHGLTRSCVLYDTANIRMQLNNMGLKLGHTGERYLNVKKVTQHKRLSREWLVFGTEPILNKGQKNEQEPEISV